jgi:AcrR family transcriptional regulator
MNKHTPARILRATAERHHQRPEPTPRQRATEDRILTVAQSVFAGHSRREITLTSMALALRIARSTLRNYFCDLDALLSAILHRHLVHLAKIIGEAAPHDDPEIFPKRRAAYLAATRTAEGDLTEAHFLLVRDCQQLPADLRPHIEAFRNDIARMVAGPQAEEALAILDSPAWTPRRIEEALSPRQAEPAPPRTTPADKQKILSPWPHRAVQTAPGNPPGAPTSNGQALPATQNPHSQAPP